MRVNILQSLCNDLESMSKFEDNVEHLKVLLEKEKELYPICKDYLAGPIKRQKQQRQQQQQQQKDGPLEEEGVEDDDKAGEAWRRRLCEWCFEVVDHYQFDREVVFYALSYLDRTVAIASGATSQRQQQSQQSQQQQDPEHPSGGVCGGLLPKRVFQLIAVTSLYMAIKIHGETDLAVVTTNSPRRKLRIDAFVTLSRGFFEVDLIENMERKILSMLQWNINPPSTLRFISSLLQLCPTTNWNAATTTTTSQSQDDDDDVVRLSSSSSSVPCKSELVLRNIYDIAKYLTELSLCVSSFTFQFRTSVVAYASILCAMDAVALSSHKSLAIFPHAIKRIFLRNINVATGLAPSDKAVREACHLLKELCPSLFVKGASSVDAAFGISAAADADDDVDPSAQVNEGGGPVVVVPGKKSPVSVAVIEDDSNASCTAAKGNNDDVDDSEWETSKIQDTSPKRKRSLTTSTDTDVDNDADYESYQPCSRHQRQR